MSVPKRCPSRITMESGRYECILDAGHEVAHQTAGESQMWTNQAQDGGIWSDTRKDGQPKRGRKPKALPVTVEGQPGDLARQVTENSAGEVTSVRWSREDLTKCRCGRRLAVLYVCVYCRKEEDECKCTDLTSDE